MADDTQSCDGPIVTRKEAKAAGLQRYFTGKPCRNGHLLQRYTSKGNCPGCLQTAALRFRINNPEAITAIWRRSDQKRYPKIRHKIVARTMKWRANNPGKRNEAERARNKTKPSVRANQRIRAEITYPGRATEWVRQWARRNPEKNLERARLGQHRRRARKMAAGGSHTADDIHKLLWLQVHLCAHPWCRVSIKDKYHIDHIVALARGGSNDRRNIQLLCPPCNLKKNAKHPIEVARQNGFLL